MSVPVREVPPPSDPQVLSEAAAAQAAALARLRGPAVLETVSGRSRALEYAGLVTRAIAFGLDAGIVNGVAALVGVIVGLALSILHLPSQIDALIAGVSAVAWVIWSIAYFTFFWSTTGQTPGSRVMGIRVIDGRQRGPIKPVRAMSRFGWLILAALPLLAGYLIMLWDHRRRCLQDRLARTVVIYVPPASPLSVPEPVRPPVAR